jgi:hypothetical protein
MQYVTDSTNSPALLSLLVSCLKQLQHSCQQTPQGTLRMVGLSNMVAMVASQFVTASSERSRDLPGDSTRDGVAASSTDGVAASSSTRDGVAASSSTRDGVAASSSTDGVAASSSTRDGVAASSSTDGVAASSSSATSSSSSTAQECNTHSEPLDNKKAPSSGLDDQSQAAHISADLGEHLSQAKLALQLTAEGIVPAASTWLLLFGRILYTAGMALQAVAAATPDTSMVFTVGLLPVPTSASFVLSGMATAVQECAEMLCFYMAPDTAASVVGRSRVQATLHAPAVITRVQQAYQGLLASLDAAAQHAQHLEEAAGTNSSAGDVSSAPNQEGQQEDTSDRGIWQQVLSSEQGQQLPQALMDVGSLLCAALPSKSCCNEPSCCSFNKLSELQLAGGKGTKCSGCGVARYCSVAHQRLHWKQHKPACKALAAAAAAAEPAGRPVKS